jgi:hypothetical protein
MLRMCFSPTLQNVACFATNQFFETKRQQHFTKILRIAKFVKFEDVENATFGFHRCEDAQHVYKCQHVWFVNTCGHDAISIFIS